MTDEKMKLEDAEKILEHCSKIDSDCGECIAPPKCGGGPWMYIEALETIIDARDTRIAELEKQNADIRAESEQLRCCGNCQNNSDTYGYLGCEYHLMGCHGWNKTNENYLKHWQRKEAK